MNSPVLSVQDWGVLVERLLQQSSELRSSSCNSIKLEAVSEKSQNLSATYEHFWNLLMDRRGHLQESNAFFSSANKVSRVAKHGRVLMAQMTFTNR